MRKAIFVPLLSLCFLLLPAALWAQFSASVTGTVTDSSGAVIPGAKVSLTEGSTHVVHNTVSNGQGYYDFRVLPPGTYTVEVDAANFKKATYQKVAVLAEQPRVLNVTLAPGATSETVTVNGSEVPLLQTGDANVESTISTEQIHRLPTTGRDPYELLRLTVGVIGDSSRSGGSNTANFLPNQGAGGVGQSNAGIFQTENQVQISAAGQRPTSNTYLLDGVSVDSLSHGGAAVITPSEEAVDQMNTISTNFSAQDGRNVGLVIKTVTKAGSNDFHGTGSFLYDEPGLNAYNSYGGPDGALPTRDENKSRDYAASLGGPIYKNKAFFFLSYEGYGERNISYGNQWIETPQFDQLITQVRPNSNAAAVSVSPGLTPRVVKVLTAPGCEFYNVPQFNNDPSAFCQQTPDGGLDIGSPTGGQGVYAPLGLVNGKANPAKGYAFVGDGFDGIPDIRYAQVQAPATQRGNQYHGRVDFYFTPRDQFFFSEFVSKLDQNGTDISTGARPDSDIPFKPLNQSGTVAYIHTFNSKLINELRANYTRFADNQIKDSGNNVNYGFPRLAIQDLPTQQQIQYGIAQGSTTPALLAQNTYEVRDTLTSTVGNHTISYGAQFRFEQDNNNQAGFNRPQYNFYGPWNYVNDAPIYEGISANPNTGGAADAQRYLRSHDFAGFVQDDWKVLPSLVLNLGMRWEYFSPLANKGMRVNQPQFAAGSNYLINATLQPVNHFFQADYRNWAPKFGFAWTPAHFHNTLVFRGGFGMAYDRFDDILFSNAVENGPGYFVYNICCGTASSDFGTPLAGGEISYHFGSSNSPNSYPVNPALATGVDPLTNTPNSFNGNAVQVETYGAKSYNPNPYIYSYTLETQKEFPHQFVATLGYQGSVGHRFVRLVNQNFLHAAQSGGCLDGTSKCVNGVNQTPFFAAYVPTPDVYTNYNGVNVHGQRRFANGVQFDVIYTFSKSMDQVSSQGPGALSNQTDPADPATEYGPSDFDVRHRVTASGLYQAPNYHGGHGLLGQVLSGWQANGIFTFHTGFPWTPVTQKLVTTAAVTSAATLSPTRPLAYYGGAVSGCSNGLFINGGNFPNKGILTGGQEYFNISQPPAGQAYVPGIGRNSFRGPCYYDTDISVAKQQVLPVGGRPVTVRFQANAYNVFNTTDLAPFNFGTNNTTVENPDFGIAPGSDSGRVVEFTARFEF